MNIVKLHKERLLLSRARAALESTEFPTELSKEALRAVDKRLDETLEQMCVLRTEFKHQLREVNRQDGNPYSWRHLALIGEEILNYSARQPEGVDVSLANLELWQWRSHISGAAQRLGL